RDAAARRGHWAIENKLHWVLDVTFREDLSRLRTGHGAKNMGVVRHFALNLVRQLADNRSSAAASAPPGTHNTCWTFSARCSHGRVNLDSLPCCEVYSSASIMVGIPGILISACL